MPEITYPQNAPNLPFGSANANPFGSPYALAFARSQTGLLKLTVDPKIFNAQPTQFLDLQYLFAFGTDTELSQVATWYENLWNRRSVTVRAPFAGTAAVPGTRVTGVIPISAASLTNVYVDQVIYYRGSSVNVTAVTTTGGSESITVQSRTGQAIPPVATGDRLTDGRTVGASGGESFSSPTRAQMLKRYNMAEKIGPESIIFDHDERILWENTGQTDYMTHLMADHLTMTKTSLAQRVWFSPGGEMVKADGTIAKITEGIGPQIENNGGAVLNSTPSTIWADMKDALLATNFMSTDSERVLFAPPEIIDMMNVAKKSEQLRYSPNDKVFDEGFEKWIVAGMTITLVPTQIWSNVASFPPEWGKRAVILPKQNVRLFNVKGLPMFTQRGYPDRQSTPAAIFDYKRYTVEGRVGTKVRNAGAGIILQLPYTL